MTRLLLLDDDIPFAQTLATGLRPHGYDVAQARTAELAISLVRDRRPDVALVDMGLPGADGVQFITEVRESWHFPIVVISARHEEPVKVAALDAGADDYVTKPFGIGELLARLRAALRRSAHVDGVAEVVTDDFRIDLVARQVVRDGAAVRLTPTEWRVLEVLIANEGRLVTQVDLLREVWGPRGDGEGEYARIYMAALRRKLEPVTSAPRYLVTEPGVGYRFQR